MSLQTWKDEFYSDVDSTTEATAVAHSLKKWTGALPANTAKHNVKYSRYTIFEPNSDDRQLFVFTGATCALCKHHYNQDYSNPCKTCPLSSISPCEERKSSYAKSDSDPTPIITELTKLL
jgi:hypothetical protein